MMKKIIHYTAQAAIGMIVLCLLWGGSVLAQDKPAKKPKPPALQVAATRRGSATQPMAVWMIG